MALPSGLLEMAKNYLDITWDDAGTDQKLTGILERGINRINSTSGEELDYNTPDRPQELLFEYARYARSNALDEWEDAFLPEILFLKHEHIAREALANDP